MIRFGTTLLPVNAEVRHPELVPDIVFYDNSAHSEHLANIAEELQRGERHLLMIGNQGTGKNKLCDRLLQLLRWEREYMQLHRDTTVQSLTTVPTLRGGVVHCRMAPTHR